MASLGDANKQINYAIARLSGTRGRYEEYDRRVLDAFGTKPPLLERAEELHLFLGDSSLVLDFSKDVDDATEEASGALRTVLAGSSRKDLVEGVRTGLDEVIIRTTANNVLVSEMMSNNQKLEEAIGRVVTLAEEAERLKDAYRQNTAATVAGRELAITNLEQLLL